MRSFSVPGTATSFSGTRLPSHEDPGVPGSAHSSRSWRMGRRRRVHPDDEDVAAAEAEDLLEGGAQPVSRQA